MKILLIALCILFLLAVCKKVKTTSAKGKEKAGIKQLKTGESESEPLKNGSIILPTEVREFGYSVSHGYCYYSVVLHNPNKDKAVKYTRLHLSAKDEAGNLSASGGDIVPIIYPGQDYVHASQIFALDDAHADVTVEVLEPDASDITDAEMAEKYTPLRVISAVKGKGSIIGEIQNDNDRDIDNVGVTVIFRDDNGKLTGGTSTLVRSVGAKSAAQYEITLFKSFETDKFELYANIWE